MASFRTMVVVPTYNESKTLSVLIEGIFRLQLSDIAVYVVDDNSPDGTGSVAEELKKRYPITVLHRQKKEGLGKAYIDAFTHLPEDVEIVIQMDADLSHDPKVIPVFLQALESCDVVLGSRYISGGKIENWNFFRIAISRFGNWYARTILGLPYGDLTGGYKGFRASVLREIMSKDFSSAGYNFQIETTFEAHKKGYKIKEIPITFSERKEGVSKFNIGIMIESFWKVLLLRVGKG